MVINELNYGMVACSVKRPNTPVEESGCPSKTRSDDARKQTVGFPIFYCCCFPSCWHDEAQRARGSSVSLSARQLSRTLYAHVCLSIGWRCKPKTLELSFGLVRDDDRGVHGVQRN